MNNEELNITINIENNESEGNEMEERELFRCSICGREFDSEDEMTEVDGDLVCQDCLDEHYGWCDDCERYVDRDNMTYIEDCDRYVCDDCLENSGDYIYCDNCNEWHSADDSVEINDGSGYYETICRHCFEYGEYYYCDECGDYFHGDDIHYDEEDDRYYCDSCYDTIMEQREDELHVGGYHEHKGRYESNIQRLESDSDSEITYGTETEMQHVDNETNNQEQLLEVLNNEFIPCVFERDGSLSYSGVECITYPYTYTWLMANVDKVKNAFEKAIELGYRSDKFNSCGIHIHVSRPSDEVVDRIWLILETFKNEIIKVARRHNDGYAHFISDKKVAENDVAKSLYYIKKNKDTSDRYYALNLTNDKTIEFRLFKGTLNYRTWLAYQQFVHNVMVECSNLDKPVEDIKWEDLVQGEYIEELCSKKNIVCYTRVVDNSKRIEELARKRNEVIDKVNKVLKKYARQLLNSIKVDKSKFDTLSDLYSRFDNYRCGDMCSVADIFNSLRALEQIKESEMTIDNYITKVKSFINGLCFYRDGVQMSEEMKQEILELININNNVEELGGEQ